MVTDHYMNIINKQIEIVYFSSGGVTWSDSENMPSNELDYVTFNFKKIKEGEEKSKQDFRKSIMEYANKALEHLFKYLAALGKNK